MKKILIALLFLAISASTYSQNKVIGDFYDHYKNLEEVTDVQLQGWLLKLAANFDDEAEESRVMSGITFLRVLVMDEGNIVEPQDLKGLLGKLRKDRFDELMQIRDGQSRIDIFVREDGDDITDVFAVINDPGESFILISLEGRLKFSDLNNLNIEVEGLDQFKNIPEKKKDIPRA